MYAYAGASNDSFTRREIIVLLKKQGRLTVQELADNLGITGMAVRRHLSALQKDRYIQSAFERRDARKPSAVYSLSEAAAQLFPHQYDELAEELLEGIERMIGQTGLEKLLVSRRDRLQAKYESVSRSSQFAGRVKRLAQIQDEEGYMVRLSESANGSYYLEQANCPVAKAASRAPGLCACELDLFRNVLRADVRRSHCMASGDSKCIYQISEKIDGKAVNYNETFQV